MSLSRTFAIFVRQLFLFKSNPTRLASIFLWLIIDIVQWGFISRYLGSFGEATFGFITVILGAIIMWEFMSRIQQGILMAFLEDIWAQNFVNFFASPLKVREYLGRSRFCFR
jgi:ABC-2 type transport system permease protein